MNILTQYFDTLHNTAPFSKIKQDDYLPAFAEAIAYTRQEIADIANNPAVPTFANTIEAMAFSGMQLERLSSLFFNLHAAETSPEFDRIAQEIAPQLSALSNDITLNFTLFERIKAINDQAEQLSLSTEQRTLLVKNYKDFVRNGALLRDDEKEKLRHIDAELATLKLSYGENLLADSNAYQLHITDEKDLSGLPEAVVEAALAAALAADKQGWIFTLDYPSFVPFTTYADNRDLRKEIAIAAGKKAYQNNAYNNEALVLKIVNLRQQRANLLGYPTHAHFILEERMAQDPVQVQNFLAELLHKAKPAAEKELQELSAFAKQMHGIAQLEKWDSAYYAEKLKAQKFELDDEILRPYFSLDRVLNGVFDIATRLFGLHFEENSQIDKYHEEVLCYEVKDDQGNLIAVFYADFFPRKGKRNGAWMTSFKPQYVLHNKQERPHVAIVCNFTRPTASKPALLSFNEVTTLFHEFGHALHGMLADSIYPTLSGTSVYWDFVELPSQLLENWCYEEEALALFAKHYQTGEDIPIALVKKIKESAAFMEGMATLRQVSFGLLDIAWHGADPSLILDIKSFERLAFKDTQLFPDVAENVMSTSFSHIFNGGYSAGYYSYKWAEVLDADAFAYFQEQGIFNQIIAQKFKNHILSKGGTDHPMTLYKAFRGQEPSPDALLKRAGLIA